MKRHIYSPYVEAFVKTDDGVFDLTPYIVSGSIDRKVNQVSSAQLTFRNPIQADSGRMLFTEYGGPDGSDLAHPLLHPMDPIVITMQRLQGHPVQVFTGYIDSAPYLQLYPGVCSLTASCTLKRLLYTQWDAALPSVTRLLSQFGWNQDGAGVWNQSADTPEIKIVGDKIQGQFTDGSIGSLLFAILVLIGQWDPKTIWIEQLPKAITDIVLALYKQIAPDVNNAENQFRSQLQLMLGSGSYGTGSPNSPASGTLNGHYTIKGQTPSATQDALVQQVMDIATGLNAPKLAIQALLEACIQENGFTNNATGTGTSVGLLQLEASTATTFGIDPMNVQQCVTQFLRGGFTGRGGAIPLAIANPNMIPNVLAQDVQGSGAGRGDQGASTYGRWLNEANAIIASYHSATSTTGVGGASASGSGTAPSNAATVANRKTLAAQAGRSPGGRTGNTNSPTGPMSAFEAMTKTANAINGQQLPYSWGGGHEVAGTPSIHPPHSTGGTPGLGYDCSGSVAAVLYGAGLYTGPVATDDGFIAALKQQGKIADGLGTGPDAVNLFDNPGQHIFMQLGGHYFGTTAGSTPGNTLGGPGWLSGSAPYATDPSYLHYHLLPSLVAGLTTYRYSIDGSSNLPDGTSAATLSGGTGGTENASAFSTMLELPSIFGLDQAVFFTGKRAFIADSPLFPFITQLAQASLRNFMSMPNGNFFAFFPDYFGLFGRQPYWEIRDIEIIDGHIDFSDDPLYTHMAVAGTSTTYGSSLTPQVQFWDLVRTAGIFDIFDAFATGFVGGLRDSTTAISTNIDPAESKAKAVSFLQKYGARPYVEEVPAIRNPFFELFLAFQNFMLAWARQYNTTFELTFMPELFPGGLVALPDHHLKLYCEEVMHTFDYVSGFTTNVTLSSPSQLDKYSRPNLSEGLARQAALNQKAAEAFSAAKLKQIEANPR